MKQTLKWEKRHLNNQQPSDANEFPRISGSQILPCQRTQILQWVMLTSSAARILEEHEDDQAQINKKKEQ